MKKIPLVIAGLSLMAVPAIAKGVDLIQGIYMGSGEGELKASLTHLKDDIYKISISTTVPMHNGRPGCGGGIDGEVKLTDKGGNFFVENEFYDPKSKYPGLAARYCEIGLKFDGKGGLKLEERGGCISYHGAACGFTGSLTHEAAGI